MIASEFHDGAGGVDLDTDVRAGKEGDEGGDTRAILEVGLDLGVALGERSDGGAGLFLCLVLGLL